MLPNQQAAGLAEERLERVGPFCAIIGLTWALFGVLYFFLGVQFTATICMIETVCAAVSMYVATRNPHRRRQTANIYMIIMILGIVIETLGSGLGQSTTPLFLCCVGLVAGHQTGMQQALRWTLFMLILQALIYVALDPEVFPVYRTTTRLERFLVPTTLTLIVFGLSLQAEGAFDRYARQYTAASEKLRDQAQSLRLAERVAKVGHWRWNADSQTLQLSREAAFICGFQDENEGDYSEDDFIECLLPASQRELRSALKQCRESKSSFDLDLEFKQGYVTRYAKYIGFSEVEPNAPEPQPITHIFGILKDETESYLTQAELNEKAEALRNMAQFDQLTGLANRRTFHTQLTSAARHAMHENKAFALLLIDLDGFKEINDTMGHAAGDVVLRDVASRFMNALQNIAIPASIARLGGDEFTIIINTIQDETDVAVLARVIETAMSQPFFIDHHRVRLGASIGAATFPKDTSDLTELLSFSDTAMYEAKIKQSGLRCYTPEMTRRIVKRRNIKLRIRSALKNNEYFLDYQPLVTNNREISGVEALLRWKHNGRVVSPSDFIHHLEESQAIVEVGRWAMLTACKQGRIWLDKGTPLRISVNISAVQIRSESFVSEVREILEESQLPPELLNIEITESVLVGELASAENSIKELKSLGIEISIDDFGTGYSALAYLRHLPFDRLKIDRTFVKDYPETDDGMLARTIIVLAHSLDMQVVAEGVESAQQFHFLRDQNCDEFQGFLFSRPLSPELIDHLLVSRKQLAANIDMPPCLTT